MGFPSTQPPQRAPSGISTTRANNLFANYTGPSPFRIHQVAFDFDTYDPTEWTVTTAGSGSSALNANGNGGYLNQLTDAASGSVQANQTPVKNFAVVPGCRMWFVVNFIRDAALNATSLNLLQMQAGFADDFSAFAPVDGIFFFKPAGTPLISLVLSKGGVQTTIPVGNYSLITNLANSNMMGFYYDGKPIPTLYVFAKLGFPPPFQFSNTTPTWIGGNQILASVSADGVNPNSLTNLPLSSTNLVAGFGYKSGEAVARLMATDYFLAANEIIRF